MSVSKPQIDNHVLKQLKLMGTVVQKQVNPTHIAFTIREYGITDAFVDSIFNSNDEEKQYGTKIKKMFKKHFELSPQTIPVIIYTESENENDKYPI